LIFLLCHPSVLFLILLAVVMSGFFVEMKDNSSQSSFCLKAKVILCIEAIYVFCQFVINIYRIESIHDAHQKEELPIILGLGTQQQLGYYEEDVSIYDYLFPFNFSILFLLMISIFTRYMGKPKL
jgi:hypothetical protein